jgi:hypothetical protein
MLAPFTVSLAAAVSRAVGRHWQEPGSGLFYTRRLMRLFLTIFGLVFLASVPLSSGAVEKHYQAATVVDIQRKTNTRVLYYIVNTAITKDEPYDEISVRLKDTIYLGRYTPRHANEALPEEWNVGSKVEARVDGHHMFLKRPTGAEMEFVVAKRTVRLVQKDPEPTPANK